jgi:hypothetical protein
VDAAVPAVATGAAVVAATALAALLLPAGRLARRAAAPAGATANAAPELIAS